MFLVVSKFDCHSKDASNPARVALMGVGKHLSVGSYYTIKSDPNKHFQFTSYDDSSCSFKYTPLFGPQETVNSSFDKLKEWKAYKGNLPALIPEDVVSKLLPQNNSDVKDEMFKSKAHAGLIDAYMQHLPADKLLAFATDPDAVFVSKDVKKGELQLFPCGTVSFARNGVDPPVHRKLMCKLKNSPGVFVINPPKCTVNQGVAKDASIVCPFFWVKFGSDEEANMQLSSFTHDSWLSIPILVNTKPIQKHSQLVMLSPSTVVKDQTTGDDEKPTKRKGTGLKQPDAKQHPKKKARGSA